MSRAPQAARYVDVAKLKPYEHNARQHSDPQVEQIKASIRKFGFVGVLAYDERGLAIGHGRQRALLEMWDAGEDVWGPGKREYLPKGKAPAIDITGLSDDERRALIIADNQLALNATWDEVTLSAELKALMEASFELPVIGFDDGALSRLIDRATGGDEDEDDVPDPPEVPTSRLGDIWLLGNHRIICGDCTDAEVVAAVLMDDAPHLMVTDPPYGIEYDANWRNEAGRALDGTTQRLASGKATKPLGARAVGKVLNDDQADWRAAWALFTGDVAYVWHAGNRCGIVAESLDASGFDIRAQIIWAKNQLVIGRGDYHPQHEPLFYAVRRGKPGHYIGGRKQTTLWEIDKPHRSETGHSTQKPLECMKRPIENNSKIGEAVYEPFSGSGTTIIAAEQTGRRCLAIELNPAYVDVAVRRWENFTDRKAVLVETGRTFSEVAVERADEAELGVDPVDPAARESRQTDRDSVAPKA